LTAPIDHRSIRHRSRHRSRTYLARIKARAGNPSVRVARTELIFNCCRSCTLI
jgi:hypothetical protein